MFNSIKKKTWTQGRKQNYKNGNIELKVILISEIKFSMVDLTANSHHRSKDNLKTRQKDLWLLKYTDEEKNAIVSVICETISIGLTYE